MTARLRESFLETLYKPTGPLARANEVYIEALRHGRAGGPALRHSEAYIEVLTSSDELAGVPVYASEAFLEVSLRDASTGRTAEVYVEVLRSKRVRRQPIIAIAREIILHPDIPLPEFE